MTFPDWLAQVKARGEKDDAEFSVHARTDLSRALVLPDTAHSLMRALHHEVSGYAESWIVEHLANDHMVTLDHKDERLLMETLQAMRDVLAIWQDALKTAVESA